MVYARVEIKRLMGMGWLGMRRFTNYQSMPIEGQLNVLTIDICRMANKEELCHRRYADTAENQADAS